MKLPGRRDNATFCLAALGWLSVVLVAAAMAALLFFIVRRGAAVLDVSLFFGQTPAWDALIGRKPVWDGIWPACAGTLQLVVLVLVFALPPGIGSGVYLAEFATPRRRVFLDLAFDMLAGVPSIVMGLFGFTLILFLRRAFFPGATTCLFLSALCLSLLVMPSLVVTTREALEALPGSLGLTAAAVGLSPSQTMRHVLLPAAAPGIMGGVILALGRAAEDTAVIMLTGVVANAGLAGGLTDKFEALPFFIYYTAAQYMDEAELGRAFGAALVLLLTAAGLLIAAGAVQRRYMRRWRGTSGV